jgi:FG-GAP-like repeat
VVTPPRGVAEIYAAGSYFQGGLNEANLDAYVVKLDDEDAQILFHNRNTGELQTWLLDGSGGVTGVQSINARCGDGDICSADWNVVGTGDFNGDGFGDVLWYNANTGGLYVWYLDGNGGLITKTYGECPGCAAQGAALIGAGDFNGDGIDDLIWHNAATCETAIWTLDGRGGVLEFEGVDILICNRGGDYIVGATDFNRDGFADLGLRVSAPTPDSGCAMIITLDGHAHRQANILLGGCGGLTFVGYRVVGFADLNDDRRADILRFAAGTGQFDFTPLFSDGSVGVTQPLSRKCGNDGCSQNWTPVGILRNRTVGRRTGS